MKIFVFGSSIVSSYWNGAATYYRGIYKYVARRGHHVTFAEPDAWGRQEHRDPGDYSWVESIVYKPRQDLDRLLTLASDCDVVIKHSGIGADDDVLELRVLECQPGAAVCFWDVDAPATIERMNFHPGDPFPLAISRYDAIFTYGGGPFVREHYLHFGARVYHSIYNGLDPETHHPVARNPDFACDLAFLGNRLPDRETRVDELFLAAAQLAPDQSFLLGGEGWGDKALPANVRWIGHVPTGLHNTINCSARMVLNINRASMASFGFSPPTRVFEAAGAGACLLCDDWPGVEDCFEPQRELIVVRSADDVARALRDYNADDCRRMGDAFLARALRDHSYARRAAMVEDALLRLIRTSRDDSGAAAEPVSLQENVA